MGDPYKGKVAGHSLQSGGQAVGIYPGRAAIAVPAICECGAQSMPIVTMAKRRAWHRQHKGDMIDTFVSRGVDDRGREVHL